MRVGWLFVACAPLLAGTVIAADSFKDVKYVSGKAGFDKKVSGILTIDEKAVSFSDERGKPLFSIPIAEIDKARPLTPSPASAGGPGTGPRQSFPPAISCQSSSTPSSTAQRST